MKENKGITLIALVITIIVLMILSGVEISMVLNGGILNKAQTATEQYSQEQIRENVQQLLAEYATEKYTKNITLEEFFNAKKNNGKIEEFIKNDDGTYTITLDGYDVIINDTLEIIDIKTSRKGSVSMTYVINRKIEVQEGKISVLVTFKDNNGIKTIQPPEGEAITGKNKTQIGIDYLVEVNKEYKFIVTKADGTEVEKTLIVKLTEDFLTVGEPIIGRTTTSTESVEDRSQTMGTKLYINFETTMLVGKVTISPSLPYSTLSNGKYEFTITGKYGEENISKKVIVEVNKYKINAPAIEIRKQNGIQIHEYPLLTLGGGQSCNSNTIEEGEKVELEITKNENSSENITTYYSIDSGATWNVYTEKILIDYPTSSNVIQAKNIDENGVESEIETYTVQPSDGISEDVFDGDYTNYITVGSGGAARLFEVSKDCWNKYVSIYCSSPSNGGYIYMGSSRMQYGNKISDWISNYHDNSVLCTKSFFIPEFTRFIMLSSGSSGYQNNIYEVWCSETDLTEKVY